jgi:hypothetical protein
MVNIINELFDKIVAELNEVSPMGKLPDSVEWLAKQFFQIGYKWGALNEKNGNHRDVAVEMPVGEDVQ